MPNLFAPDEVEQVDRNRKNISGICVFFKFCQGERVTCFSRDVKRKQNKPRSMLYTKHERLVKGSLAEKLPIYERHPSKVK